MSKSFEDYHREYLEKVWLKKKCNCRSSSLKFSLPRDSTLRKMKRFIKIQKHKILKNGKNGLDIC